jgi:hypothetical protein
MQRRLFRTTVRALAACALGAVAFASSASAQEPAPAQGTHPIRFTASLDGAQSNAINSTALETRQGTGSAVVTFDPLTGDLSYDIQFEGLIAEDITLGPPRINPDGTPTPPGTVSGNDLPGGGLFLLHFHVGFESVNGPIPVDIVAQTGPAVGVISTDPTPIQRAAAGRVIGAVNIFDLATNGFLLNGVPVDGRDDGIRDAGCARCGLIEAFLLNAAYVNIHTFNNPFGEVRGQLIAEGCASFINTIDGLQTAVDADPRVNADLRLALVARALERGDGVRARRLLLDVIESVTRLAHLGRLDSARATDLICGATNVLISIPVADEAPGRFNRLRGAGAPPVPAAPPAPEDTPSE